MQFSNPSIIRKGSFTFCATNNSSTACGRTTARAARLGSGMSAAVLRGVQQLAGGELVNPTPAHYATSRSRT